MTISGHRTRAVFNRYNIVSENDLKEAARRLGEYVTHKNTTPADPHTTGTQEPPAILEEKGWPTFWFLVKVYWSQGEEERRAGK